jgi:hypothetical protein
MCFSRFLVAGSLYRAGFLEFFRTRSLYRAGFLVFWRDMVSWFF